ncbi:uncharacterized protein LOC124308628 [Neodiprion virginianus]|uniref:uncharacterized protein LOC124186231 n=1 Tax=Neodiprion fabricii TaxID=2872261 RepID=UPI001ED8CE91|nr:uncharacterized protein LOC124186088 isoform X1 [Neodiprion fabricii]XP_046433706.1 uncharacterized protein LOC124186231 [Neodiprion fabricii]XP_046627454.1 uncharacterized protein LOC124308628 [Neodiprion virginianus]
MDNLQNLEERCEDAVFKVCDARERFSRKCAEGLDNYLFLETRLVMKSVVLESIPLGLDFGIPSHIAEQVQRNCEQRQPVRCNWNDRAKQLQCMMDKIDELKIVLKQVEDNRNFELSHHFR